MSCSGNSKKFGMNGEEARQDGKLKFCISMTLVFSHKASTDRPGERRHLEARERWKTLGKSGLLLKWVQE